MAENNSSTAFLDSLASDNEAIEVKVEPEEVAVEYENFHFHEDSSDEQMRVNADLDIKVEDSVIVKSEKFTNSGKHKTNVPKMDLPSTSCGTRGSKRSRTELSDNDIYSDEEEILSHSDLDNASDGSERNNDSNSDSDEGAVVDDLSWQNCDIFNPTMYHFDDENSGISGAFEIENEDNEYEYFVNYFDEHMMTTIVGETNRYQEYNAENDSAPNEKPWVPTNVNEMYSFLAIILLMPHIKRHKISEYWSTDPIIASNFISKYMARDRFTQLLRYIHFADNNNPPPLDNHDKLWKIRTILEEWNQKCSTFFHPFQKLVIDESQILFKGRRLFKQFIPPKRHRFGIKIFVLCDCKTGIVLNLLAYTGSEIDLPRNDPLGASGAVIKKLMVNYEQKGHLLYIDNWYTSPKLAIYLDQENTGLCSAVKQNRKHFPKFLHRVPRGTCERKICGNVMALRWKDKRDVLMLSTFHQGVMTNTGKLDHNTGEHIWKPDCVIDYTQNMINKCDMQLDTVECVRKSIKWYKKLFFHLVDVAMLNAYNMFLVKTGKTSIRLNMFIRKVVQQILEKHGTLTAARPGRQSMEVIDRLAAVNFMERHSPANVPPTGRRQKGQRICHVCSNTDRGEKKRKCVTTWCAECKVGLCIDECYKIYHTRKHF